MNALTQILAISVKMIREDKEWKTSGERRKRSYCIHQLFGWKALHPLDQTQRENVCRALLVNFEFMVLCLTHFLILGSGSWGSAASDPVSQVFVSVTSWRKRRVYSMLLPSRLLNTMACEKKRIEFISFFLVTETPGI